MPVPPSGEPSGRFSAERLELEDEDAVRILGQSRPALGPTGQHDEQRQIDGLDGDPAEQARRGLVDGMGVFEHER